MHSTIYKLDFVDQDTLRKYISDLRSLSTNFENFVNEVESFGEAFDDEDEISLFTDNLASKINLTFNQIESEISKLTDIQTL